MKAGYRAPSFFDLVGVWGKSSYFISYFSAFRKNFIGSHEPFRDLREILGEVIIA
jgi:hypothetical protein